MGYNAGRKEVEHMLGETIKALRKAKGMNQEDLASRLNVVRQTVSKWEKGLSVPDADLLQKMAEVFETDVSGLLGAKLPQEKDESEIARHLANINEQLAVRNRRSKKIWRTVAGVLIAVAVVHILLIALSLTAASLYSAVPGSVEVIETFSEETLIEE